MMRFDVLTLFPEVFDAVLGESIIGRARKNNIIQINTINIRDFSTNKHRKVDDYPYGGGGGMVMMAQPIYDAYLSIAEKLSYKPRVIYLSPQGRVLNQQIVKELSKENHLILLCGHYEGVDERIIEEIVDDEISIGDYVLTGGELPAMVLIDSVSRLIPGVLSSEESYSQESHYEGLLEYPQYTRPYEFCNRKVPDVLMSGHHENINRWRRQQSLKRTYLKRPDLFARLSLDETDKKLLEEALKETSE
ncbi:tRNA (guanine37-N1)-methyltransferase [Acetivibrio thermocellus AD2]|jgi:tRNA (guanine37-N1)-methyltransferase|uniref:tRNA (guanine-N(1)-)-methyltransferase n=3 Tax=Acetivibrio thermocellus TaxID=1515 RepID=A3DDH2_ACET2|nr:tRNA (guanine-N1)-methyltransferase [Acetivibrio thermocellus ATCC 27405]ADU74518.1 tRNA (guanine-N1)-methyltransferase [Acetivibrio thermocellus DSM 1313]ALX08461.1 tRNA (guanine-N(1)-)-methyltransferase [Acetivibrio thermocellus AD2]ANV76210.1 tRNA (guanine-N(1)-)-methyltransferase [Acetivibrio thermocellus DSM 2360]EIC05402.1 tRNA (guanine-N1)-methyltransferase [Acetivibrio thermocellus YS]CDG35461.1 tRNA (guanine-N(1)-)-methyltransferase [Acetivibrio thermocellus BC1]SOD25220.1 tRNA (g